MVAFNFASLNFLASTSAPPFFQSPLCSERFLSPDRLCSSFVTTERLAKTSFLARDRHAFQARVSDHRLFPDVIRHCVPHSELQQSKPSPDFEHHTFEHTTSNHRRNRCFLAATISATALVIPAFVQHESAVLYAIPVPQIMKSLEPVPVFSITTDKGSPLLATSVNGLKGKVGVFFMNQQDAEQMLNRLKTENPAVGKTAKIMPVGLDKAWELQREYQNKKGDKGEEIMFRIFPHKKQVEAALKILRDRGDKADVFSGVPVFQARGLTMKHEQDNSLYIPLFFNTEDLENAWAEMRKSHPSMKQKPDIEVGTLEAVLEEMDKGTEKHWTQVVFFPPSDSVKYLATKRK